jgi:hypothetical protein
VGGSAVIKLAGVAIDARVVARGADPVALAEAARWIAANALAARGVGTVALPATRQVATPSQPIDIPGLSGDGSNRAMPAGRRYRVRLCGRIGPTGHRDLGALADLLAALAVVPALIDPAGLPITWRLALRALGIPLLDRPATSVLAAGACVLDIDRGTSDAPACTVEVTPVRGGYHVRVAASRLLAA